MGIGSPNQSVALGYYVLAPSGRRNQALIRKMDIEEAKKIAEENPGETYIDYKDRLRCHLNDKVANELKAISDLVLISGKDERISTRCSRAYRDISRHDEPIDKVAASGRLIITFALSKGVAAMVEEFLESGSITFRKELEEEVPGTVLELCEIPWVGGKTVRMLYQDRGIDSLAALEKALDDGKLDSVKGIGKKTINTMRQHIENVKAEREGGK